MTVSRSTITDRMRLWSKRAAVHYLGTYTSSVENLKQVMERKAARKYPDLDEADVHILRDIAVAFCIENGFLDDSSYAETKVAAATRKGDSKRKIAMKLNEKGVDRDVIDNVIAEVDDFRSAINFAKRRRIGPWRRRELDLDIKRKEMGAFARNGFSGELSMKVIKMSLSEAEDIIYGTD